MIALAATLHDPDGRLIPALRCHADALAGYAPAAVAATAATDPAVAAALRESGATIVGGDTRVGVARRAALRAALDGGAGAIFACDFDRWLHWAACWPDELAGLAARIGRRPPPAYVCLGRSARAFASHPEAQRLAEGATNRALSLRLGRPLDATAGAAWIDHEAAAVILAGSVEPTNATDLEWPALCAAAGLRVTGLFLDGLAFETAAFAADEVADAGGLAAWMALRYGCPAVWAARLRLAADSVAALDRVLGPADGG